MTFFEKLKGLFQSKEPKAKKTTEKASEKTERITVITMEKKYEEDDLVGAAKDLKALLEYYGTRKKKNHRYKGREFIHFLLSNKHKDLKNIGYEHWQNINRIIQQNQDKVYPYHKNNLRKAMDFYESEIRDLKNMIVDQ